MDSASEITHQAHFTGEPHFEMLSDGRLMRLLADYGFVDAAKTRWPVPKGATIDGASIPQIFWPVVGSPYVGRYRNASVIHDWYCDVRTRPWRQVHRMFHEAMLVSGVRPAKARLMYLAVYYGGPRWNLMTVANNELAQRHRPLFRPRFGPDGLPIDEWDSRAPVSTPLSAPASQRTAEESLAKLKAYAAKVEAEDLSLDQIDAMVDAPAPE